ncbi:hypothetical protein QLS91_12985 [Flavobacterium sp. LB2P84]|uniref:hypothetical protein n=1 Tax=Flavobacterium yafengii TaxID=3041253 RepID=UPI0024A91233|nr:hypothetical protein [Flavobacterium yafengii]MDI6033989.1 hypothetical protein [Flavobacterium yafengii]
MANYITSLLLDFQTKAGGVFKDTEMREKQSQLLSLFMKNPTSVIPDYDKLKTSDQRAGAVYLLKRTMETLGTNRAALHAGNFGDSFKKDLTWKTYSRPFKLSMKAGDRNIFDNPERFNNEMKNAVLDIHAGIDADIAAFLALQKTQLAKSPVGKAIWNGTTFVYEVANAEKEYYFQVLKSAMSANGHRGALDLVSDSIQKMEAERLFTNGTTNAKNTAFQASNLTIYEDHNLADAAYKGLSYAIPEGAVAALPWIPMANRTNQGDENGATGLLTSFADPLGTGLTFALSMYKKRADTNTTGGEYQDFITEFEVSIDMAYVTAPLSGTNESAIVKFGQLGA